MDAGPSRNLVQLGCTDQLEDRWLHLGFHDPKDHEAEDMKPFPVTCRCPLTSGNGGSWSHTGSPFSFADKGDTHVKTAYSRIHRWLAENKCARLHLNQIINSIRTFVLKKVPLNPGQVFYYPQLREETTVVFLCYFTSCLHDRRFGLYTQTES